MTRWGVREGDCVDAVTGMPSLPDRSVDHVITDPPFEGEAHGMQRRRLYDDAGQVTVVESPLEFEPMTESLRLDCATQFARLARRWVLVFCQVEAVHLWRACLMGAGLDYVRTMVWIKPDAQPQYSGDRPGVGYESIVVAHQPGRKEWSGGGRVGVFSHTRHREPDAERSPHPTMKPLPLMTELVRLFTDENDLILDPFCGSGTTGVACKALGRSFLGWEMSPEYAALARRRINGDEVILRDYQPSLF